MKLVTRGKWIILNWPVKVLIPLEVFGDSCNLSLRKGIVQKVIEQSERNYQLTDAIYIYKWRHEVVCKLSLFSNGVQTNIKE